MATQVLLPKQGTINAARTTKKAAARSIKKECYVIYSIYYNDQPEGGYVVYSNDQSGWEFFGYQPSKQPNPVTEPAHRRFNINLL